MRVYAVGAAIISLAPSVSGFHRIGSELLDETAKLLGSFRKLPRVFLRISRPPREVLSAACATIRSSCADILLIGRRSGHFR